MNGQNWIVRVHIYSLWCSTELKKTFYKHDNEKYLQKYFMDQKFLFVINKLINNNSTNWACQGDGSLSSASCVHIWSSEGPLCSGPTLSVTSQRCDVVDSEVRTERVSIRAVSNFCFDLVWCSERKPETVSLIWFIAGYQDAVVSVTAVSSFHSGVSSEIMNTLGRTPGGYSHHREQQLNRCVQVYLVTK